MLMPNRPKPGLSHAGLGRFKFVDVVNSATYHRLRKPSSLSRASPSTPIILLLPMNGSQEYRTNSLKNYILNWTGDGVSRAYH